MWSGVFFFLLLSIVAQGLDLRIPVAEPISKDQPTVYSQRFFREDKLTGSYIKLDYDVEVIDKIVNLDFQSSISRVICDDESLVIEYKKGIKIPIYQDGSTIVGSSKFGCRNQEGEIGAFYRKVIGHLRIGSIVRYETEIKTVLECFKSADIQFYRQPPDPKKKRIDYFGPVDNTDTWQIWGWNYNGAGGASNSLPIYQFGGQVSGIPGRFEVGVDCTSCFGHIDAGLEWALYIGSNWGFPQVKQLKLRAFGDLTVNVDAEMHFEYSHQISKLLGIIPDFNPIAPGVITFFIGSVPIEITPLLSLDARVDLDVHAKGSANIGFDYVKTISTGLEYRVEWGEIRQIPFDSTSSFNYHQPTFSIGATSDVRVTFLPKITLKIYNTVPFFVKLEPYIGAELAIGDGSGCSQLSDLHYQLYGGLDFDVGLAEIEFKIFGVDVTLGKSVGLPTDKDFTIIPKEKIGCSFCSGCINLSNKRSSSHHWTFSSWSSCSASCDGGIQTRNVTCVDSTGNPVSETFCGHASIPSDSRSCNVFPCPTNCSAISNCRDCIQDVECGWCGSTNQCESIFGLFPDSTYQHSSCPSLQYFYCPSSETPIEILIPSSGSGFLAGESVDIEWTGGPNHVFVVWRWTSSVEWHSAGLASNLIDATVDTSFTWETDPSIPPAIGSYEIAVVSLTDPTNFDIIRNISVTPNSNSYFWAHSSWTKCSTNCGNGTQSRNVECHNNLGEKVALQLCGDSLPPSETRVCNRRHACKFFPLKVQEPVVGANISIGSKMRIAWTGGKEGNDLQINLKSSDSSFQTTIHPSATNNGVFEWDIQNIQPGKYQIQISSVGEPSNNFETESFFLHQSTSPTNGIESLIIPFYLIFFLFNLLIQ